MTQPRQTVFLIDGGGAVVSTAATAAILFAFQPWFGMPSASLVVLLGFALVFCVYSLTCWTFRAPLTPWLPMVMAGNLGYCILLIVKLTLHRSLVTTLGLAYFILEVFVILAVVAFEFRVLRLSHSS